MKISSTILLILLIINGQALAQPKLIGTNAIGGNGYGTIYKYNAGDSVLSDVLKLMALQTLGRGGL
ncbi:MAG: hypothetical protein IPG39_05325 [Bacteroidetes bacterium]|nr:hypothetical protein [Bacteroidota bacterium]